MSLMPLRSIASCVYALTLMGTLLSDSSRRFAVTVTSCMMPVSAASLPGVTSAAKAVAPHTQRAPQTATRRAVMKGFENSDAPLLEDMNPPRFKGVVATQRPKLLKAQYSRCCARAMLCPQVDEERGFCTTEVRCRKERRAIQT